MGVGWDSHVPVVCRWLLFHISAMLSQSWDLLQGAGLCRCQNHEPKGLLHFLSYPALSVRCHSNTNIALHSHLGGLPCTLCVRSDCMIPHATEPTQDRGRKENQIHLTLPSLRAQLHQRSWIWLLWRPLEKRSQRWVCLLG